MRLRLPVLAAAAVAVATPLPTYAAIGDVLFADDFEGGASAANYTVVTDPKVVSTTPNNDVVDFAYAYTNVGDDSDIRSGTGAYFETQNAITAFISSLNLDGSVQVSIRYDMMMQPRSSGSSEYGTVGVGSGAYAFESYLRGSLSGQEENEGVFAAVLGDVDTLGDGDYVILEGDGTMGEPTELYNADAAGSTQGAVPFGQVFPGGTGTFPWRASRPENHWTDVQLLVVGDQVSYILDGTPIATVNASADLTGMIGIGLNDPFPSTNQGLFVPPADATSMIIDNIVITEIPEPASLALVGAAALLGFGRVRRG